MNRSFALTLCLGLSLTALTACDSVRDSLGSTRRGPDEFRVTSRPPLTVPPEFALRPPAEDEETAGAQSAGAQARAAVLGESTDGAAPTIGVSTIPAASPADQALLEKAGATKADPKVRESLLAEERVVVKQEKEKEGSWMPSLWPKKKEKIVDASKESERIKETKEKGDAITKGDTPTKKESNGKGILGDLF